MKKTIGCFLVLLMSVSACQDKGPAKTEEAPKEQPAAEKAPVSKSERACKNLLKLSNSETFSIQRCETDLTKKMGQRCKTPADFEKFYDCMIAAKTLEDALCDHVCPAAAPPSASTNGATVAEPTEAGTKAP
jgi:hypothetical protein